MYLGRKSDGASDEASWLEGDIDIRLLHLEEIFFVLRETLKAKTRSILNVHMSQHIIATAVLLDLVCE